jgi:hypothetical protein
VGRVNDEANSSDKKYYENCEECPVHNFICILPYTENTFSAQNRCVINEKAELFSEKSAGISGSGDD